MGDSNDFLSQDELDALLGAINSGNEPADSGAAATTGGGALGEAELDMIGEVGNMIMGAASTALFTILGKDVDITTPKVSIIQLGDLKKMFNDSRLVTTLEFQQGISGLNVLVVDAKTANIIADLMMGGTGQEVSGELDEIKMSAVGEAVNQMMGAASTAMSEFLSTSINISPPKVDMVDFSHAEVEFPPIAENNSAEVVMVSFDLSIKGLAQTDIFQVLPIPFVKNLYAKVTGDISSAPSQPAAAAPPPSKAAPSRQQAQKPSAGARMPPPPPTQPPVSVKPVEFEDFDSGEGTALPKQLELLYDVPLEVTVELGRSRLTLREVLDLNIGSIVELDKLTGEHVDILVNGKMVAKGEVVVVEESFGVKVTEILNPNDRIRKLG
ncbi:MAG TPA: flagellar motor switch phosphatase FliY [Thermotogota bacterium]|nr:flagellar motor switch phosphatase FliY [Thermotogota bacterium]HRW92666.1 flagellar motor switch phosphatase FliY [Thermotogota bacterium]